jgi:hypothetical protein
MHLKTVLFLSVIAVLGVIMSSYFVGGVLTSQVIAPFGTLRNAPVVNLDEPTIINNETNADVVFVDADLQLGWIPWIIRQASILIGGLSLIVFVYAGISLIAYGDNEEQLGKSTRMIIYAVVGIVLAAFSYSIIANLLSIFS